MTNRLSDTMRNSVLEVFGVLRFAVVHEEISQLYSILQVVGDKESKLGGLKERKS